VAIIVSCDCADKEGAYLLDLRKRLHRTPEPAFKEHRTAKLVEEVLVELGLEVSRAAGTGVVGLLRGGKTGPTVAVRADMDALPVTELTGVEWASQEPGMMHACGHDAHMAMALGAAMALAPARRSLAGNVKFIFQPAEEWPGGAKPMIAEGVMDNPDVDMVFAMHVSPDYPAGTIAVEPGYVTAAQDRFTLELTGRGGHAALPHRSVDALAAACEFVTGLQQVVARRVDPLEPAIVHVGTIHAGDAFNIVAGSARMEASVRTLSDETRVLVEQAIRARVDALCAATGVSAVLDYAHSYPSVINSPEPVRVVREAATRALGDGAVTGPARPSMVGEDFAYFARRAPGALIWIGARPDQGEVYPLHHPKFLVPDATVFVGVALWKEIVTSLCV
jgi:amidohydrolase